MQKVSELSNREYLTHWGLVAGTCLMLDLYGIYNRCDDMNESGMRPCRAQRKMEDELMGQVITNIGWAVLFSLIGGTVGIVLILLATISIPRLVDRLTPEIDEEKEIARGNRAVAEYFGRIVSASIIGVSIVIAAAILGGILVGLGF